MRIGLYDPYLSTLGGGENVLAVLAAILEAEFPTAQVDLIAHADEGIGPADLASRFEVRLERTRLRIVPWPATPFDRLLRLDLARRMVHESAMARVSAEYDLFVNNTIYSTAPCRAAKSLYLCMFPLDPGARGLQASSPMALLRKINAALRRAYFKRSAATYSRVVANSRYTQGWVARLWGLESDILYPPVKLPGKLDLGAKRRRILSVGRFFAGEHNKKHAPMIETFVRMREQGLLAGWDYHLVGSVTPVPGAREYAQDLVKLAGDHPVHLHFDAPGEVLADLLRTSRLFWHATGLGEDPESHPEKMEHFGISTIEAMAHGCVPVVIAAGGQPEIVSHDVDGLLWRDLAELAAFTTRLVDRPDECKGLARAAFARSRDFSREAFELRAREILRAIDLPAMAPLSAIHKGVVNAQ